MAKLLKMAPALAILYAVYITFMAYENHTAQKALAEQETKRLSSVKQKKQKDFDSIDEYLKKIEEEKGKIELLQKEMAKLTEKLPNKISDAENLEMIMNLAKSLNMKNIVLKPEKGASSGLIASNRYVMNATATYLQFLVYFEKIDLNPQLLNIHSLKMTPSKESQRGKFQLLDGSVVIEAYYFANNSVAKEKSKK